jgi:hypothetical protein
LSGCHRSTPRGDATIEEMPAFVNACLARDGRRRL